VALAREGAQAVVGIDVAGPVSATLEVTPDPGEPRICWRI